ncbi:TPA_asm: G [Justicia betacytorhabdovirus 1]|nr:TPA_asm: G [Justicia betacytorhabdovirus 1]
MMLLENIIFFILVPLTVLQTVTSQDPSDNLIELSGEHKVSITPLAHCGTHKFSLGEIFYKCLADCPIVESSLKVTKWRIYDKVQERDSIDIFVCRTLLEEYQYTETWLFSRNDGNLQSRETVRVDEQRCQELFKINCDGKPCSIIPKVDYAPEYEYASTIRKSYKYSVGSVLSTNMIELYNDAIKIGNLPGVSIDPLVSDRYVLSDDKKIMYLWNVRSLSADCIMKDYVVAQCLNKDKKIVCPQFGISSTLSESITFKNCRIGNGHRKFYKTNTGILVEVAETTDKLSKRQYIEDYNKEDELRAVLSSVNQVIMSTDERVCMESCLSLTKSKTHINSLQMAGYNYVLFKQSNYVVCRPLKNCQVKLEEGICGDPALIRLNCNREEYWWDPTKLYISEEDQLCAGHKEAGLLEIRSNLGVVMVNKTGAFLKTANLPNDQLNHPDPLSNNLMIHDVLKLPKLLSNTKGVNGIKPEVIQVDKVHSNRTISDLNPMPFFRSVITSVSNTVRLCILILITIIILFLIYKVTPPTYRLLKRLERSDRVEMRVMKPVRVAKYVSRKSDSGEEGEEEWVFRE